MLLHLAEQTVADRDLLRTVLTQRQTMMVEQLQGLFVTIKNFVCQQLVS